MTYEEFDLLSLELPGIFEEPTAQPYQFSADAKLSPKLAEIRRLANLAAKTGLDMNEIDNDDPVYETEENTPSLPVSPSAPLGAKKLLLESNQTLLEGAVNDLLCGHDDIAKLCSKYGLDVVERAKEIAKTRKPTRQQVMVRYNREERQRSQQLWKDLKSAGVEIRQHSVQDFVRVIQTQLDLQEKGENLSAERVLQLAFPDDEKKARSVSNSTRRARWKQAYKSDAIENHPVQTALRETHGARAMQLRLSTRTFRNSLGVNAMLYQNCNRIACLQRQVDSLTARVEELERQMRSTKLRESLADADCTSSREKVLALRAGGMGPTAISEALDMPVNTVKSILHRSRQS